MSYDIDNIKDVDTLSDGTKACLAANLSSKAFIKEEENWAKMLPVQKCFNLNLNNYFKFNLKLKLNFEF